MERGMSGCSSARSSLEEPFGRRGVQRFLKITRTEITSCSRAVLGLKPGQGSCCRAPRVCRAAGPGGGATGVPHTGQGRASLTGWLGEMLMLCLKVGEQGQGLLLGRFLRMWGWSPRCWKGGHGHVVSSFSTGSSLESRTRVWICWKMLGVCRVSAASPPAKSP